MATRRLPRTPAPRPTHVHRTGGTLDMTSPYELPFVRQYNAQSAFEYPSQGQTLLELPRHFMVLGGTNSGKSASLMRTLFRHCRCFQRVYIVAKDVSETLYQSIQDRAEDWSPDPSNPIEVVATDCIDDWDVLWAELKAEVNADRSLRAVPKVVIFDDLLGSKVPNSVLDAANRGRKYGLTCCWITSSLADTDKRLRNNISYVMCMLQNSDRDAARIFQAFGLPRSMMDLYHDVVLRGGFLLIDNTPTAFKNTNLRVRDCYKPVGHEVLRGTSEPWESEAD